MANYETKLSFGVDVKGAQSAQKALDDLSKRAVENAKKQRDSASALADALAKSAEDAKKAAEIVEKSGKREDEAQKKKVKSAKEAARAAVKAAEDAGRAQERAIKQVQRAEEHDYVQKLRRAAAAEQYTQRAAQKAASADARMTKAQTVTSARQGAFTQGLVQGAMPGGITRFIDRGPGAFRQAAGITLGSVGSSLASIPFTGLGGVMGAAGAVGSVLSDPLQRMFGNTAAALGRQRSQLGIQHLLGGYGTLQMPGTGGMSGMSDAAIEAQAQASASRPSNAHLTGATSARGDIAPYLRYVQGQGTTAQRRENAKNRLYAQRERDRTAAPAASPLQALGGQYGMSVSDTQQFVASQASAAGGTGQDLASQGLIGAGLAAQTKYGVGAGVSGAFGRAGRNGGIVGGGGDDRAFASMIGSAVALGLQGSDLTRSTEQMASILGNFESTGIPLAMGAIGATAQGFKQMGLSASMAQSAGVGVTSTIQNIGENGPQDSFDVAAMQALGGDQTTYTGQLATQRRLRNLSGADASKVFSSLAQRIRGSSGGRGEQAHQRARALLRRFGAPHDDASADALQKRITAGNFAMPTSSGGDMSPEALSAAAQGIVAPELQTEAEAQNRKATLGERGVRIAQAADKTADATASGITGALASTLGGLTSALTGLTAFLEGHMGTGPTRRVEAAAAK